MKRRALISWSGNVQTQGANYGKVNEEITPLELEKSTFVFERNSLLN